MYWHAVAEQEQFISEEGPAANAADIPGVFGATEDDTAQLRIVSLNEVGSVRMPALSFGPAAIADRQGNPQ